MTVTRFMRDRDGLVHELYPYEVPRYGVSWSWPSGHVVAYLRVVEPASDGAVPTCLTCIREHEKMPEHVRARMVALLEKFVR